MPDIYIRKKDDVYMELEAEPDIIAEISEFFTFKVKGAEFSPAYRNHRWDGMIRLVNRRNNTLYMGLLYHLTVFCQNEGYGIRFDPDIDFPSEPADPKEVERFYTDILNIHSGGNKILPREHQVHALNHAISSKRSTLISATSSGKSLVIYALIRYLLEVVPKGQKILLIVPSITLVNQMYNDFEDYSSAIEWDTEENCHKIFAGQDKIDESKRIYISTYQSIYDLPKKYFKMFGAVIGDECHKFRAKTLKGILEKMKDCPYRFGLTGTLQDSECNRLVIEGLFGPAQEIISASDMIQQGYAPELDITGVILDYPEHMCKELATLKRKPENKDRKYEAEKDYIFNYNARNDYLLSMVTQLEGNTLILFDRIRKYGESFYWDLKAEHDGSVFFIDGNTDGQTREQIRSIMEEETNAIIVASYGVFSTGVSIKNLHNLVFAESPGKTKIRVVQSIGRILRKHESKTKVHLYDVVDNLAYKNESNYMIDQFMERINLYINEGHDYQIRQEKLI